MAAEAEEKTEETQEKGELDDRFLAYAEDEDGWGIIRVITSGGTVNVYTGRKSERGRFYERSIPKDAFFTLIREVLKKLDDGHLPP